MNLIPDLNLGEVDDHIKQELIEKIKFAWVVMMIFRTAANAHTHWLMNLHAATFILAFVHGVDASDSEGDSQSFLMI